MNSNTNVSSVSESNTLITAPNMGKHKSVFYAVTFRPCENKVVTLIVSRKKYGDYTLDQQKEILETTIRYCEMEGLLFSDINFETTELKGKKLIHFHAILEIKNDLHYNVLKNHAVKLNARYGPKTYTAFDYRLLLSDEDLKKWKSYIAKDKKWSISEWCCGI